MAFDSVWGSGSVSPASSATRTSTPRSPLSGSRPVSKGALKVVPPRTPPQAPSRTLALNHSRRPIIAATRNCTSLSDTMGASSTGASPPSLPRVVGATKPGGTPRSPSPTAGAHLPATYLLSDDADDCYDSCSGTESPGMRPWATRSGSESEVEVDMDVDLALDCSTSGCSAFSLSPAPTPPQCAPQTGTGLVRGGGHAMLGSGPSSGPASHAASPLPAIRMLSSSQVGGRQDGGVLPRRLPPIGSSSSTTSATCTRLAAHAALCVRLLQVAEDAARGEAASAHRDAPQAQAGGSLALQPLPSSLPRSRTGSDSEPEAGPWQVQALGEDHCAGVGRPRQHLLSAPMQPARPTTAAGHRRGPRSPALSCLGPVSRPNTPRTSLALAPGPSHTSPGTGHAPPVADARADHCGRAEGCATPPSTARCECCFNCGSPLGGEAGCGTGVCAPCRDVWRVLAC